MSKLEILQGTLDLLILRVINSGAMHGFGIAQKIHLLSQDALKVEEGSLYPALYRMERKGWIKSKWGQSENNRRAKYYNLTRKGKKQLKEEEQSWERLTTAIAAILESAE